MVERALPLAPLQLAPKDVEETVRLMPQEPNAALRSMAVDVIAYMHSHRLLAVHRDVGLIRNTDNVHAHGRS